MKELYKISAVKLLNKIKSKKISVVEASKAFLSRIEEQNPKINAIYQVDPERILSEALSADKKIATCKLLPKLIGLPLSIKDAFHVEGFISSKGAPSLYKSPSTRNATVVQRLRNAGAIIYGLTNTSELLLSYESDNLIYGRTNNPYDLTKTAGGSSGGQAAIIAVGGTPVGIGSDAGGSIRQPAHYCGIAAHKPTKNLIPLTGTFPLDGLGLGAQLLTIGPMARYVEDLMLIMSIISGSDNIDPHCINFLDEKKIYSLKSLRINYFFDNPTGIMPCEDTVKAISEVIKILANEGAIINENYPDILNQTYRLHFETLILGGDGGQGLRNLLANLGQKKISSLTESFLKLASRYNFSVMELRARLVELEQFRYHMMHFFSDYDLMVTPVTATTAKSHGKTFDALGDVGYVIVHNLTGWPATVIPCGYDRNGLPIGVQIVAKPGQDYLALSVALKLQKILKFRIN